MVQQICYSTELRKWAEEPKIEKKPFFYTAEGVGTPLLHRPLLMEWVPICRLLRPMVNGQIEERGC